MRNFINIIAEGLTTAEKFMHGECASFAMALHELTGWPIYSEVERGDGLDRDVVGYHVCCYCEDLDVYVDVRGQATLNDILLDPDHTLDQVSLSEIAPHTDDNMVILAKAIIEKDTDWYGLE